MLKVLVKGPALSMSGYGEQTRYMLAAIKDRQDIDLYLVNINWGKSNNISAFDENSQWLKEMIAKSVRALQANKEFQFDVSIQVTIPNEWENIAPINIGYTAGIECDRVSPVWIEKGNMMNKIITISQHSKDSYSTTKYDISLKNSPEETMRTLELTTPIEHIGYATRNCNPTDEVLDLGITTSFNFLTVSQFGPRKDLETLLQSFLEKYKDNPDVGLIVKTHTMNTSVIDKERTRQQFKPIMNKFKDKKCKVYLLHGEMTDNQMTALYQQDNIHAYVTTTHGEGFGLPIFEAVCNGMPVLAPDFSGHIDFLYANTTERKKVNGKVTTKEKRKALYCKIPHTMKPVDSRAIWKGVIEEGSLWAYCDQAAVGASMEKVQKNYGMYKKWAEELKTAVLEEFPPEKMYAKFNDLLFGGIIKEVDVAAMEPLRQEALAIANPKARSKFLKEKLIDIESQKEKLALLEGMFTGDKCYVLSCGPTLLENDQENLKSLLKDNVSLAIKQSYDMFSDLVDFHVYNCGNYKNYEYGESEPIIAEASTAPWKLGKCDLKFFIKERDFQQSVSAKHNLSDWTLDKQQLLRPYGPGIMYELVFYMIQHLGFSEIVTVGWDNKLSGSDQSKQHFYDKDDSTLDKSEFIHYNEVAENVAMEQLSTEEKITSDVIGLWSAWLSENGCTVKICSNTNPAPQEVERVII